MMNTLTSRAQAETQPAKAQTVLLLHAAVVNQASLALFARRLRKLGFIVHNPAYPNRKLGIFDCAEYLKPLFQSLAESCPGPIHLAGHSMGGLVARRLLHLWRPDNFGRLITMGSPHLGSPLADIFHKYGFYKKLFGPAGQDLVTGRSIDWLAPWPPPYQIGLIAGNIPIGPGSFHLAHPSDGTVRKVSAQPYGGAAYVTIPATHTTIPYLKRTARLSAAFFRSGSFETSLDAPI